MRTLPVIPIGMREFATAANPLRPSRLARFLNCPMQIVLGEDREGGRAAQTGNLVHDGAEAYHKCKGTESERVAAAYAALDAARANFPDGDAEEARQILGAYLADKENQEAKVLWCEEPVRLTLPAAAGDPTGQPVVIQGTLDQVREYPDGTLGVVDIKTGTYHKGPDTVTEYLVQQAAYLLAARQTLSDKIDRSALIYTHGYRTIRGQVHFPNPLTVDQCETILLAVPPLVAAVRRGEPVFRPSVDACRFCDVRPWPKCYTKCRGLYG